MQEIKKSLLDRITYNDGTRRRVPNDDRSVGGESYTFIVINTITDCNILPCHHSIHLTDFISIKDELTIEETI